MKKLSFTKLALGFSGVGFALCILGAILSVSDSAFAVWGNDIMGAIALMFVAAAISSAVAIMTAD